MCLTFTVYPTFTRERVKPFTPGHVVSNGSPDDRQEVFYYATRLKSAL